ncbi:MAG: hypothetical protein PF630_06960 [Gammaproteobacteria bacterium]|jgi:hypothetical protein|uniref:hypothetical protein n=1 Tax=Halothiobacillus sp. TaxID=1891311 RepID=UPI002AD1F99E|nr:hypothetical protein [Halothiobacillus sp.]MDA3934048.1 hypothetical protein [Gammaproteobacteria bacterium]
MSPYRHHVSGFFAHRAEAESALSSLVERGVPNERLQIFDNTSVLPVSGAQAKSDEVLTNVLVDGAIGTAVGVGIGALGEVALVAASVSLFIASPLIAPIVMMGWGASIGGLIGAASGVSAAAGKKEGRLADLVRDAISSGQVVLVAESRTEQETAIAREVIQASVGDYNDVSTA